MVFTAPAWVPKLPFDPPDTVPLCEFMFDEQYGRTSIEQSRPPFTCGLSGKQYSVAEVKERVEWLARGLSRELGWTPNEGTEWDKIIAIFAVNTIDTLTLSWAVHSLGGISSPANAAYQEDELVHQLKSSGAKAIFTCLPLLQTAIGAAAKANIPRKNIYLLSLPSQVTKGVEAPKELKNLDNLVEEGGKLPVLEKLKWSKGQGARQTAFLCYSSGTSGLPKGVMISHRNIIANTLQMSTFEDGYGKSKRKPGQEVDVMEVSLGLLPQSHIYSLVVICHVGIYRGYENIILPNFDMGMLLRSIQRHRINTLYLVPPIIIALAKNGPLLSKFDLSSVEAIYTGGAPLGEEVATELVQQHPNWILRQGYGLTETSTVVVSTPYNDVWFGSCGVLLPAVEARIMSSEGTEVNTYDTPGELVVKSPSVVLGYLNNKTASKETFHDGWMSTGDVAVVKKSSKGNEHFFIVDRIKELIKVKGMQVAPAELEAHLLAHPSVTDCAVIQIPDDQAGERPKAYVVKSSSVSLEDNDRLTARSIMKHVEQGKARHKWLAAVEFVDVIPKSPSGKILRRLLRDRDKEERRRQGVKL